VWVNRLCLFSLIIDGSGLYKNDLSAGVVVVCGKFSLPEGRIMQALSDDNKSLL
tara:strand:+ start:359 stop:520 length:162 start_codon:yes stop_codon:yes gene_type:complete